MAYRTLVNNSLLRNVTSLENLV